MKQPTILLALCLALTALPAYAASHHDELVYIGTHGSGKDQQDKAQQGIYAARFDTQTGHFAPLGLQVELERATWLVIHPTLPIIYTVAESREGSATESNIHSFAIDKTSGKLTPINQVAAGGLDATHMDLDPASKTLFVASYASGTLTALPLQVDGSLGPVVSTQKDYGTGPHPRQKMPIAHGVAADPSHHYVLVADLGADRIFVYHFDGATRALTPGQPPFAATAAGSGPRHLVFHPNGKFLYVETELTADLLVYGWDAKIGRLQPVQTVSPYPADYSGKEKSAGELAVSADGRFVYISLRGDQDSIVGYAVNQRDGTLKEIQRVPCNGKTPWSFGLDPTGRWMLVTNEASDSVSVLHIDPATGLLTVTNESLSIPKPVTVVFYSK
jgi:6-phosphogluconolactonase